MKKHPQIAGFSNSQVMNNYLKRPPNPRNTRRRKDISLRKYAAADKRMTIEENPGSVFLHVWN